MRKRERSQTEQLRQALAEREAQLQEAQARLAALEGSTSLQVGRALTSAAKSPRRGLARLPRDLYRLWRGSGGDRSTGARRRSAEPVRSYTAEREEARLLSGSAGSRDERLVAAGVLSAEARDAIEPYVRVASLRPHDAQVVFDSLDIDLVMVSASAALPGTLWAHVGDPAVTDRTRTLRWVLEAASARGVPTILVLDAPAPPALRTLGFDLVYQRDLGVPLHRFSPVATEPERDTVPTYVPGATNTGGPIADLVAMLATADSLRRAESDWRGLPDLLRRCASVVVDDAATAARALACGARIVPLGRAAVPEFATHHTRVPAVDVTDAQRLTHELDRARDAGPLTPEELRSVLRSVFLEQATPVRLAEILAQVSLSPGANSATPPLEGRRTALLASPQDEATSLALADDVLEQAHPPSEVIVPRFAVGLAGVRRLRTRGVPVRDVVIPASESTRAAVGEWAWLAEATDAPWVMLWQEAQPRTRLVDLLCAAECSGADAVGPAIPPWEPRVHESRAPVDTVDWSGADQDYIFVSTIRPELARRELVARGLHPGVWSRHGARLLALGPVRVTTETPR